MIWANYQNSIEVTNEEVIDILMDTGYEIVGVQPIYKGEINHSLCFGEEGYDFFVVDGGKYYGIELSQGENWKGAKVCSESINDLDERMGQGYFYNVYYGKTMLVIHSGRELGENGNFRSGLRDLSYLELGEEFQNLFNERKGNFVN